MAELSTTPSPTGEEQEDLLQLLTLSSWFEGGELKGWKDRTPSKIARTYWGLTEEATTRDLLLATVTYTRKLLTVESLSMSWAPINGTWEQRL